MILNIGTFVPLNLPKEKALSYIEERAIGIKHSIGMIEKTSEHLVVRCPLSGDYVELVGSSSDLDWVSKELEKHDWYRIKKS